MSYKNYKTCRISNSENLIDFFEFKTALAGDFHRKKEGCDMEKVYPLTLSFCPDSGLVQVNEVISGDELFEEYYYKTGTIGTLVKHFDHLSEKIKRDLKPNSIFEIGCNDFTLLKNFENKNLSKIVGVDPSDVSKETATKEITLYNDFFTSKLARIILEKQGTFEVITTSNSFAHIEDIRDVTRGFKLLLSDEGTAIIEVHWLGSLIKNLQFPFIYHEHMYYYSLKSISYLLNQYGLRVFDVEKIQIHGGSIRFYCCHKDSKKETSRSVDLLAKEENELGLYKIETYLNFTKTTEVIKERTMELLKKLKSEGYTIIGYGASGQANTLMAYYGISKEHIDFIVDDSPLKIGCYTPNNCLPIISSEELTKERPDYIFCFAYTFYEEIRKRNANLDTKWIIPLPDLKIL